jgi:UPF0716 protein FxsA
MLFKLFLLFTVVPFIELALLIKIGTIIGLFETILIIVITGMAGALMVRSAGIECLFRIQKNMDSGIIPTEDLFSGVLILVAGAFLLTPGLITDAAGFILLIPVSRDLVKKFLKKYVKLKVEQTRLNQDIMYKN